MLRALFFVVVLLVLLGFSPQLLAVLLCLVVLGIFLRILFGKPTGRP